MEQSDQKNPIYRGKINSLYVSISNDGPVVIAFDPWYPHHDGSALPFAFEFYRAHGINVVSVKSEQNDWYQNAEIAPILDLIDLICGNRVRVGYGSSMGGYAVLNFSSKLKIDRALLFAPQFSIDRSKVPFEHRWQKEASEIAFVHDQVGTSNIIDHGAIFYDPFDRCDQSQIELIQMRHRLSLVRVPFGSHMAIEYFGRAGALSQLAISIFETGNSRKLIELRRSIRATSPVYWAQRAALLLKQRKFYYVIEAVRKADNLPNADRIALSHLRAAALYGLGHPEQAVEIWSELLTDELQITVVYWRMLETAQLLGWQTLAKVARDRALESFRLEIGGKGVTQDACSSVPRLSRFFSKLASLRASLVKLGSGKSVAR